jgi:recombination protein RecA
MSSAVVSTSAALGRPFLFEADPEPHVGTAALGCPVEQSSTACQQRLLSTINSQKLPPASIVPASRLETRATPEMVTSGIPALDALTGGLPRGCLTEIYGPTSSGRTSVMLAALAAATLRGEYCAVIDASDALDPHSLAAAGIDLDRLLWVRCDENSPQRKNSPRSHRDTERKNQEKEFITNNGLGQGQGTIGKGTALALPYRPLIHAALAAEGLRFQQKSLFKQPETDRDRPRQHYSDESSRKRKQSEHRLEQVLRATDLLLESGGFGLIILDLAYIPHQAARRIPLTTWFRFRRAVEHKPTILLAIEQQPIAGSCSSLLLQLGPQELSRREVNPPYSDSSREAAVRESPARQCRVGVEKRTESYKDVTISAAIQNAANDVTNGPHLHLSHSSLFTELKIHAELIRSRLDRKPARSIAFETKTAWAG